MAGKKVLSSVVVKIEDVDVLVERKAIKNINLAIYPPDGRIRVSVPYQIADQQVLEILQSRLAWLRKERQRIVLGSGEQEPEPHSIDDVYLFGVSHDVKRVTGKGSDGYAVTEPNTLTLYFKDDDGMSISKSLIYHWYRQELRASIPSMITYWQSIIGVEVLEWRIRRMKTRWGTCNITKQRVWLNLELARFPVQCLEYVIVHEMVHLLERYHNARFKALMDSFLPEWRSTRKLLNDLGRMI